MNRISVVGCGYVGLVSGAGLAEFGNSVVCIDNDTERIRNLRDSVMPFFEPSLKELIGKNIDEKRLEFSDNIKEGIMGSDIVILAVQTPQAKDGKADLSYITAAAEEIAISMESNKIIVIKSTVPVGTAVKIASSMNKVLADSGKSFQIEVVSNPEFLIEGSAVSTFLHPDRIVIGFSPNKDTRSLMEKIYLKPATEGVPLVFCSNETAETVKYAANAFLAMKIAYINQIALLCEKTGADINTVAATIGSDSRINPRFLNPGPGYGGSCFPKDTKALVKTGEEFGVDISIIRATDEANEKHKKILARKVMDIMHGSGGKILAVWGLAFKAGTGDIRNSSALTILPEIAQNGLKLQIYDPEAMGEAKKFFGVNTENMCFCGDMSETLLNADGVLILTEWSCFKEVDLSETAELMKGRILFDFRNLFDRKIAEEAGFSYYGVGR